jgi:hypothetical protein
MDKSHIACLLAGAAAASAYFYFKPNAEKKKDVTVEQDF